MSINSVLEKLILFKTVLPAQRYAGISRYRVCVSVRVSVCHTPVL